MKYDELDDRAKARARDQWREGNQPDDWWDCIYEDVIIIGALMGIEIGTRVVKTVKGKAYDVPDISFSGFCSQGDGASFGGYLDVGEMKTACEQVGTHVGNLGPGHALFPICRAAEEVFAMIAAHSVANRLEGLALEDTHYPECEPTMSINIKGYDHRGHSTRVDGYELPHEIEMKANGLVSDFADYIYAQLEAEDEYLNSDEYVVESIEANEPNFDESGNIE